MLICGGDDSIFAIDKDANEYEIDYRDIERIENIIK